jgi:CheY-like chemotaxis protein
MVEHSQAQHDIIVVDDNPANIKLLEGILREQGYEVRSFLRGRLRWRQPHKIGQI